MVVWGKTLGTTKADTYVSTINEMCIFLADNQNIGIRKDEVTKGLKSYPINSHVVFYIRQNNKIYIIRFLHKKMDYQQHLVN